MKTRLLPLALLSLLAGSLQAAPSFQQEAAFTSQPGYVESGLVSRSDGVRFGVSEVGGTGGGGCLFVIPTGSSPNVIVITSFATEGLRLDFGEFSPRLAVVSDRIYGIAKVIEPTDGKKEVLWRYGTSNGFEVLHKFDRSSTGSDALPMVFASGSAVYGVCNEAGFSMPEDGPYVRATLWRWTQAGGVEVVGPLTDSDLGDRDIYDFVVATDGSLRLLAEEISEYDIDLGDWVTRPPSVWNWDSTGGFTKLGDVPVAKGNVLVPNLTLRSNGTLFGYLMTDAAPYNLRLWSLTPPAATAALGSALPAGGYSMADMVEDTAGNLFGVTATGGTSKHGQIFRINAGSTTATVLASLPANVGGLSNGRLELIPPSGSLGLRLRGLSHSQDAAISHGGTIWTWNSTAPTASAFTTDLTLTGIGAFGRAPSGVVTDRSGAVFGVSQNDSDEAVLWKSTGVNDLAVLATLPVETFGSLDDETPVTLVLDAAENIYGVTHDGETAAFDGCVWRWNRSTGVVTKLANLGTSAIPGYSNGSLAIDPAGNLYGISRMDIVDGAGDRVTREMLWRCNPAGVLTSLGILGANEGPEIDFGVSMAWLNGALYMVQTNDAVWRWTAAAGIIEVLEEEGVQSLTVNPTTNSLLLTATRSASLENTYEADKMAILGWTPGSMTSTVIAENCVGRPSYGANTPAPVISGSFAYGAWPAGGSVKELGLVWRVNLAGGSGAFESLHVFNGITGARPSGASLAVGANGLVYGSANELLWSFGREPAPGTIVPSINTLPNPLAAVTATFDASIDANGSQTTVALEWGTSATTLTNTVLATPSSIAGSALATRVSAGLNGLQANTTYFARWMAGNSIGVTRSATFTFRTLAASAPTVVTSPLPAGNISHSSATLVGTINSRSATVSAAFDYGLSATALNQTAALPNPVTSTTAAPVSLPISGLLPHTKYFYRLRANGPMGSGQGTTMNFTTNNRAPTAGADTILMPAGTTLTLPVLANDNDADGDALSVLSFAGTVPAAQGRLTRVGNNLVFAAASTFTGPVNFTYIAADAFGGRSTPATVSITLDSSFSVTPTSLSLPAARALPEISMINVSIAPMQSWRHMERINLPMNYVGTPLVVETLNWLSTQFIPGDGSTLAPVVFLVVEPNSGAARNGSVQIAGVNVTVNQAAGTPVTTAGDLTELPTTGLVGTPYVGLIRPSSQPTTITLTGRLPSGLTFYPNGLLAGVPKESGAFSLSIKVGTAAVQPFTLTINSLPTALIGSFTALAARTQATGFTGARASFTITSNGEASGEIVTSGARMPFVAPIRVDTTDPQGDKAALSTVILVGTTRTFQLDLTLDNRLVTGTLRNLTNSQSVPFAGGQTLPAGSPLLLTNGSRYVATLDVVPTNGSYPQGTGYLTLQVATGGSTLSMVGKLADGTAVTGSLSLYASAANTDASLHVALPGGTGVLTGLLRTQETVGSRELGGLSSVGSLSWWKLPQPLAVRAYRSGFDVSTNLNGVELPLPDSSINSLELLHAPGMPNVVLKITGQGIGSASQWFNYYSSFGVEGELPASNTATFNFIWSGAPSLTFAINRTLGTFAATATFTDNDAYAPLRRVTRKVAFEGVLAPFFNSSNTMVAFSARGFGLLPRLAADEEHPAIPANPANGTSLDSLNITVETNDPR